MKWLVQIEPNSGDAFTVTIEAEDAAHAAAKAAEEGAPAGYGLGLGTKFLVCPSDQISSFEITLASGHIRAT